MSDLETLEADDTGPPAPEPAAELRRISSGDVAAKIDEAQAALGTINANFSRLAFEAASGSPDAEAQLATAKSQRAELSDKVETLRTVHAEAVAHEHRLDRRRTRNFTETQVRAARSHITRRNKAAARLSAAIIEAVAAYREMVESGEKAATASPDKGAWLRPSLTSLGKIREAVSDELWKVGGDHRPLSGGVFSFPPCRPPSVGTASNPDRIEPLADLLKRDTEYLVGNWKQMLAQLDGEEPKQEPGPHGVFGSEGLLT